MNDREAKELVKLAELWWKDARHQIDPSFNAVTETKVRAGGIAPAIILREEGHDLPSGILRGFAWDDLTRREKLDVVKAYRRHVLLPQRREEHFERARDEQRRAARRAAAAAGGASRTRH